MASQKIRVLSLIEAQVVTSPARIMLRFAADMRSEIDFHIVNLARGADTPGYTNALTDAAQTHNLPVTVLNDRGPLDLRLRAQLKRLIREYRPDIIQTNSLKSHFLLALLGPRSFGWVAFHHGYTSENTKMRFYNRLDRFSLRFADQVVTVCQAFARELAANSLSREKIEVIPNGIPGDFLIPDSGIRTAWHERFRILPEETVVLNAGRLSSEKGHRYLIQAAAQLRTSGLGGFRILIAGTGLLEDELQRQIVSLGVEDIVDLIGFYPDVRPLFQAADLFVLPSLSEGSPMVLLESMIAGVPVICTTAGGLPEMVTHDETALLVPPADSAALAEALRDLLTRPDRARRIARNAYDHVISSFNLDLYNRRVLTSFETVLRNRESQPTRQVRTAG